MKFNLRPYSIEVIEHPERKLGVQRRRQLVDELTRVAKSAFGPGMTREDVERHTMPVNSLIVARRGKRIVGFSSNRHLNLPSGKMLYLAGTAVERESSGAGLYSVVRPFSVLHAMSTGTDFRHIGSRTQNPIIYASLGKLGMHPKLSGEQIPQNIVNAAVHLAEHLSPGKKFDSKRFVIRGAFGSSLYDEPPRHRDEMVNRFVYGRVRLKKGDGLLVVAEPNRPHIEELFLEAAGKINKKAALEILAKLRAKH